MLFLAGCATSPEKISPALLQDEILTQERLGLEALKTGDLAQFSHSTADDAVFIDSHGAATKAEVMKNVADFRLVNFSMTEAKLVPLSAHAGLIVYTLTETGNSHGHEFKAKAYVSSLWEKRGHEWFCLFSQETGARK